jgi:microcystin-dependent protein
MKNKYCLIIIFFLFAKSVFAQDQFVGEVRLFANNYPPKGWARCEGQLLQIRQNTALFSILGVTYGGDGRSTFALPDLRDRMAVDVGQGPGLSEVVLGQMNGSSENITLTPANLPAHTHSSEIKVSSTTGTLSVPTSSSSLAAPVQVFNGVSRPVARYNEAVPDVTLPSVTTSITGSSTPLTTQSPSLGLTYCIALEGYFPQRQ